MPHDPRGKASGLGYFRVRSPLLTESRFLYFPAVTEMFHFAAFAQEFRDQRLFDSYPELIAAFHAFQSRLVPRHPPYALNCLTTFIFGFFAICIASAIQAYSPWTLALHVWSALRLCIADFTTTELSKTYVNFRDRVFWAAAKGERGCYWYPRWGSTDRPDFLKFGCRSIVYHWRRPGSNRQPLPCKGSALPIELRPRTSVRLADETRNPIGPGRMRVGVLGFEPRTSALSELRSSQLSYTPARVGRLLCRLILAMSSVRSLMINKLL